MENMEQMEREMGEKIDCVMPAAGESSRMGEWKLLMRLGNETIAERSVRNALEFCARIILVVGYRGSDLRGLFSDRQRVVIVENPNYRRGMFSSIRLGVRAVRTRRFFVALADMPFVPPHIFRSLARLGLDVAASGAVRPVYLGTPGHPVLLPESAIDKILQLDDSHTMKEVLRGLRMSKLETEESGVTSDIDTPEDFRRHSIRFP